MAQQTIMVIDDDEDILKVISYILTEAGYLVISGSDVTALYEIEKRPPNLLLIDNWMTGKTGHDICFQLKNSPKTNFIPVVLISATMNLEQTARSCGADGYITKPFDANDLVARVKEHVKD